MTETQNHPVIELARELIAVNSVNPQLVPGGAGEGDVAQLIARRLAAAGLEVRLDEVLPGRPNVIGRLRGTGGGRTLMLCGHMDVVGAGPEALVPTIRDGRLYGRGAVDMKGGLAAAVVAVEQIAAAAARGERLAGDVVLAGVIDEEWVSAGAERLAATEQADAAILPEQSDLDVVVEHGGFAWFEIESLGVEAPGIEPELAVDAIALLTPVLQGLVELDRELQGRPRRDYGRPSIHPSTISGGTQFPAYPSSCKLGIERCTVAGETTADAHAEIDALLARAAAADPRFRAKRTTVVAREPVALDVDGPLVKTLDAEIERHTGHAPAHIGDMGWADSGLLTEAGIPCAIFGPTGDGHHTDGEYVELDSLVACAEVLTATLRSFCGTPQR